MRKHSSIRSLLLRILFSIVIAILMLLLHMLQEHYYYAGSETKATILTSNFVPTGFRPGKICRYTVPHAYQIVVKYTYHVESQVYIGRGSVIRCGTKDASDLYQKGNKISIVYDSKKINKSHIIDSDDLTNDLNTRLWFLVGFLMLLPIFLIIGGVFGGRFITMNKIRGLS